MDTCRCLSNFSPNSTLERDSGTTGRRKLPSKIPSPARPSDHSFDLATESLEFRRELCPRHTDSLTSSVCRYGPAYTRRLLFESYLGVIGRKPFKEQRRSPFSLQLLLFSFSLHSKHPCALALLLQLFCETSDAGSRS